MRDEKITIDKSSTFAHVWTWTDQETGLPVDLTAQSATMKIADRDGATVHTASSGSEITLGVDGTITVVIDDSATGALSALTHAGRYWLWVGSSLIRTGEVAFLETVAP